LYYFPRSWVSSALGADSKQITSIFMQFLCEKTVLEQLHTKIFSSEDPNGIVIHTDRL